MPVAGLALVAVIADTLVLLALFLESSPDLQDFIDEYQGRGGIADDWALEPLDRAARWMEARRRASA